MACVQIVLTIDTFHTHDTMILEEGKASHLLHSCRRRLERPKNIHTRRGLCATGWQGGLERAAYPSGRAPAAMADRRTRSANLTSRAVPGAWTGEGGGDRGDSAGVRSTPARGGDAETVLVGGRFRGLPRGDRRNIRILSQTSALPACPGEGVEYWIGVDT